MPETPIALKDDALIAKLVGKIEISKQASPSTVSFFIEPMANTLSRAKSPRSHVIFGRRGSGKSSLLRKAEADFKNEGKPVAYIDCFRLKQQPSLANTVLASLASIGRQLSAGAPAVKDASTVAEISRLVDEADQLAAEPDQAIVRATDKKQSNEGRAVEGKAKLGWSAAGAEAGRNKKSEKATEDTVERAYETQKLHKIRNRLGAWTDALQSLASSRGGEAFVLLDDLYQLPLGMQVEFLDIVHSVLHNTGVWLKVGTIRNRSQISDLSTNRGLELGHDADEINLDTSLETFTLTREFLIKILSKFCSDVGLDLNHLVNTYARDRLVQASGGVARDFLDIVVGAIGEAQTRIRTAELKGKPTGLHVGNEDVYEAATALYKRRSDEFKHDTTSADDRQKLLVEADRITEFCFQNGFNCILVKSDLGDTASNLVASLMDLKVLHIVRRGITLPKNDNEFSAYMLDLSQHIPERRHRKLDIADLSDRFLFRKLHSKALVYAVSGQANGGHSV